MNLYLFNGRAPTDRLNQEIIISRFEYQPLGSSVAFEPRTITASPEGSEVAVNVESTGANCAWSVAADSPWLQPLSASGTGTGVVRFRVPENWLADRVANVQIETQNCNTMIGKRSVRVSQPLLDCRFRATPIESIVDWRARSLEFMLSASWAVCKWTLQQTSPWLWLQSPASGAGDTRVRLQIQENTDPGVREGGVQANKESLHRIVQDGAGSALTAVPNPIQVCDGSGLGATALYWTSPVSGLVEIRKDSVQGPLIGRFSGWGSSATGKWVGDKAQFFLVQPADLRPDGRALSLASTRITLTDQGCGGTTMPLVVTGGVVNAASFLSGPIAPGMMISLFGRFPVAGTIVADRLPLPTALGGISVKIGDVDAPLFFVSQAQINVLVPGATALGRSSIRIGSSELEVPVAGTAPGIFTANGNGQGVPSATAVRVLPDGTQKPVAVFSCAGSSGGCQPRSIPLGDEDTNVILTLYGTGVRGVEQGEERPTLGCVIGGESAEVIYAGPQGQFEGLDQVNVKIPRTLVGRGDVDLVLTANERSSQRVQLRIE